MQIFWHFQKASNKHLEQEAVPGEHYHTEISLITDISILLESASSKTLLCMSFRPLQIAQKGSAGVLDSRAKCCK